MKAFSFGVSYLLLLSLLAFPEPGLAQRGGSLLSDSAKPASELRLGIRYTSDYVFMGRRDSVKAPYVSPSIGYFHKSGFFMQGALAYLSAAEAGRIDVYILSGGYAYWGRKVAAGVSVSEYFFNEQSYAVQAEMSTYLEAFAGYDFSAFLFYTDASLGFSEGVDAFLGAEINRPFFALGNKLRLTPSLYVNAGTQRFYSEYYSLRSSRTGSGKGKGKGANGPQFPNSGMLVVEEAASFKLLDYELALQALYKIKRVRFFASATWAFPLNPATVVADQQRYQESLDPVFFWTSGVRVSF
jgi:hypothetical protein